MWSIRRTCLLAEPIDLHFDRRNVDPALRLNSLRNMA